MYHTLVIHKIGLIRYVTTCLQQRMDMHTITLATERYPSIRARIYRRTKDIAKRSPSNNQQKPTKPLLLAIRYSSTVLQGFHSEMAILVLITPTS